MSTSASLSTQQRDALNEFRNAVSDILQPRHDDEYLLRWLIARNFDVSNAEKMIRKSHKLTYNLEACDILNTWKPPRVLEKYMLTKFWGFDAEGSPVRFLRYGKVDWRGIFRSTTTMDFLRYMWYIFESDQKHAKEYAQQTGNRNLKTVFVADVQGASALQLLDKLVLKSTLIYVPAYPDNFPELLKVVYLINAPAIFHIAFTIIKPFLDERTLGKFRIFSDGAETELLQHIGPKLVPKYYGGEQDDPDLDPDNFSNVGEVPRELYINDDSYIKPNDPNTIHIFVHERSFFHHKIKVKKPDALLKWVFQSKNFNIKYGLFLETSEDTRSKSALKELVKTKFVDSHVVPERDEFLCEQPGVYILQFDNTHSWIRKKHILLQILSEEPKSPVFST